jgi:hypothetical protein
MGSRPPALRRILMQIKRKCNRIERTDLKEKANISNTNGHRISKTAPGVTIRGRSAAFCAPIIVHISSEPVKPYKQTTPPGFSGL